MKRFYREQIRKDAKIIIWVAALFFVAVLASIINAQDSLQSVESIIDAATYKREEFFGSQAIVPIPTLEAYENLLTIADSNEPKVFAKLGESAEKLGKFDEAENYFIKAGKLEDLAGFYQRRGTYLKKAETLEVILKKTKRLVVFEELIEFAQLHELNKYLQPKYIQQVAVDSKNALPVIEKLIDKFVAENQHEKLLVIIRNYKSIFPEKMLEKEVALLSPKDAEKVYYQAFNPFWRDEESEKFYRFLSDNDRLHAYGLELKTIFRKNPADYQTAIRLIHYKQHVYDEITPTILQLKRAKKTWNAGELLTIARFLLKEGNGDLASKFLYTLNVHNDFSPEMRGKISYQIFKILCDAENQRLSLTKGDLNFYRDIAAADTHPGITTGILSLIFSDTDLNGQLIEKERVAAKLFNRAAAFRIFQNYKKEFPESSEIGQMYLDLIEIYTRAKDTGLAEKLLNEFTENSENSNDFPRVAMNLADAFIIAEKPEKEAEILQKVMDFLGKQGKFFPPDKIVDKAELESPNYYENNRKTYADMLGSNSEQITYADTLARYIALLSKEKKVAKIHEIYSNEIVKYPAQEWLYEQRLSWLEQTNLFNEQLQIYKNTLERFPTNNWRDKLARWFIRNKKQSELEAFSADLVGKLNDDETEEYLRVIIGNDANIFDEKLYLALYETAHRRFPHNLDFVKHLLKFYRANSRESDWRNLSAEYYFESTEIRSEFLTELTKKGELQYYLNQTKAESVIYQLFRADACLRLSRYEESLESYRKLVEIYPNNAEFANHLVNLTRSFGQKNRQTLSESASFAKLRADFEPSNAGFRTVSGEIYAELGDYKTAKIEWQKLIETGTGSNETYLETASVFWDYFQYDEALKTISDIRVKSNNTTLYAFETGAISESQHKRSPAVSEYLKALESDDGKAQKRLKTLAENDKIFAKINAIFHTQPSSNRKALHYAEILRDLEKTNLANRILSRQINLSKDVNFLESAQDFSTELEPIALKKLADISISPRKSIAYRLQLADFYRGNNQPNQAKQILVNLQRNFPTNYGVLTECADFYWSLGANAEALKVLQNGFSRSIGNYRFAFASRLAKRLISLDRLADAENFLVKIHQEKPTDSDVFYELANVCVRQGNAEGLQTYFAETVTAIKLQDIEPKEVSDEIAELRQPMIAAFTELKDYRSAVEQHIEIINREPDEEANVDAAIKYVKRYGGGDLLLKYYQKTSDEAFKNYRWNVVLARICEANGDAENAVRNYRKAIDNQPEMTELYAELVRIETQRKNYAEALIQLDKIIELSGEEKNLLKQKVQLLQALGKNEEAKIEQEKLPVEAKPIVKPENQFAEAEKAKSIEMFRSAFQNLLEKPLENELNSGNITGYINTLRHEENLDTITERLFLLREKLLLESEIKDSTFTGEAKKRRQILDNAMMQTVGNIAKTVGTDEELLNLHTNLSNRIDADAKDEQSESLTFLQDFSARAGFGDLVEKVLIKRGNSQSLIEFYNERGAFQKVLEIAESTNNLPLIAGNARLINNREKELNALRQIYQDKNANQNHISRYLQIVDKPELESLAKQNSPNQLQLINFLLGKGERDLAHAAIENSNFQKVWKLSRHAETSLALKEFDEQSECYFCEALNLGTIDELVKQQPDKTQQLIGNDWFSLAREYGEWLDAKRELDANKFLVSMIENLPKDASEQAKLGDYYLAKNELEKSKAHFQLSLELNAGNVEVTAKLGETFWRFGEKQKADECFTKVLKNDALIYLQTLTKLKLQRQAQDKLFSLLVEKIKNKEPIDGLLLSVADSFVSENEKAAYFLELSRLSDDENLVETLIDRNFIAKTFRQPFYDILVKSNNFNNNNYEFEEISRRAFSNEDAEEVYDHENNFKLEEVSTLNRRREYLDFLLENGKFSDAKKLIKKVEDELKGKLPRPVWLRLAHFQLSGGNLQKIVGIEVTDKVVSVKLPDLERLNEAVAMLKKTNRDAEAEKLKLNFYARMLELEQYTTANYVGLARQYFKLGDRENGLKTLQTLSEIEHFTDYRVVAEVCEEFGQTEKAIEFRRKLDEITPDDFENKFELAKLLPQNKAVEILQSLVNNRNMPRSLRWKARMKLYEIGETDQLQNNVFDAYSQFYNGILLGDENCLLNSLITDNTLETLQLQQLIKIYAEHEKPFAAFRLTERDKNSIDDELLDLLSKSAEKIDEFQKAIEFESNKSNFDEARMKALESLETNKNKRVTDFTVDDGNASGSLAMSAKHE